MPLLIDLESSLRILKIEDALSHFCLLGLWHFQLRLQFKTFLFFLFHGLLQELYLLTQSFTLLWELKLFSFQLNFQWILQRECLSHFIVFFNKTLLERVQFNLLWLQSLHLLFVLQGHLLKFGFQLRNILLHDLVLPLQFLAGRESLAVFRLDLATFLIGVV